MTEPKRKNRRDFLKTGVAGLAGVTLLPAGLRGEENKTESEKAERPTIHRTLGKTGFRLPIVSMGVMNADNPKLVEAALEAGIVHLDTAWAYQRGRNEEMVGQTVKSRPRDSYVVATKVYEPKDRKTGLYAKEASGESFLNKFETSLKRLGLDYVDILYMHSVPRKENVTYEPLLSVMLKLKQQGKARFIGTSTHMKEPEVIRATIDAKVYDVVLTAYNFKQPHRDEVKKAIAEAAKAGLGVVAMKTQAGVYWDEEKQHPINMKAALKWVLLDENVHTSIPGFTTFDQMEDDLSVMADLKLTKQEEADLQPRADTSVAGMYCAQCEACRPQCRWNVDIPALMRSYMYAHSYKNLPQAKATLETCADAVRKSPACQDCQSCTVTCAMGLDVRKRIIDISRLHSVPADLLA
jgi:predicted aldo/keto reductase-like oxidoreductase